MFIPAGKLIPVNHAGAPTTDWCWVACAVGGLVCWSIGHAGPARWVNLLKFSTHSPTALGPLIAHGRWKSQHAEQGSIYLEFQTCTSAHPFETHL